MKINPDIDSVIEKYIDACVKHHAFTGEDSKKTNAAYQIIARCAKRLRELPDKGMDIFRALMRHEHRAVRVWAATDLLRRFSDLEAVAVLEKVSAESFYDYASSDARIVLEEWRKGQLGDYIGSK
jgi:hypothetical protein